MLMNMRKKVKLAFIEDETSRKKTFKKKMKTVLKKIDELLRLCDLKACVIVFPWPSREGVEELVSKFMKLSLRNERKKMVNQNITKAKEQLQKLHEDNIREKGESSSFLPPPQNYQSLYEFYAEIPQKLHEFNLYHSQKEQVYFNCQPPYDLYDKLPEKFHAFNLNDISDFKNFYLNSEINLNPNEEQSSMDMSREHMGDAGEHGDIPSIDNHHNTSTPDA